MHKQVVSLALFGCLAVAGIGCAKSASAPSSPPAATGAGVRNGPDQPQPPSMGLLAKARAFQPGMNFGGPVIAGDRLFWMGWAPASLAARKIYAVDLTTDKVTEVTAPSESYSLGPPYVTGHWLVYVELLSTGGSSWRLVACNLSTGDKRVVAAGDTGAERLAVAVDAGRVIWIESDPDVMTKSWSRINLYDLQTGQTRRLIDAKFPETLGSVDISGDYIVYTKFAIAAAEAQQSRLSGASDVYLYDLDTGSTRTLPTGHDAWQAKIYGDHVVWKSAGSLGDYGDIVMLSLQTGNARTLTSDGKAAGISYPTIGDGFVTWRENLGPQRIRFYSMADGTVHELDRGEVAAPEARGPYLMWRSGLGQSDARIRWVKPAQQTGS